MQYVERNHSIMKGCDHVKRRNFRLIGQIARKNSSSIRSRIQQQATKLNLRGYVRFTPSREVEVCAEGKEAALKSLLGFVTEKAIDPDDGAVETTWDIEPVREDRFTIKHTL